MIKVVLRGSHGGELDSREVLGDVNAAIVQLVEGSVIEVGDTITIEEVES